MKALSVNQPWAWLIVNGYKPIENRNRDTKFRGRIAIHTGKKFDRDFDFAYWESIIGKPIPRSFDTGGLVGEVTIAGVTQKSDSPFFFGPYGYVLIHAHAYDNMIPCVGQLGFFEPDLKSTYKTNDTKGLF